jgi:type IV pilus assembly protein PilV
VKHPRLSRQQGFSLLEVLVSVLVFSLGVLALVQLQATSMRMSTDARHRADAAFLADQLFARMLISLPLDAANFAHHAGEADCLAAGGGGATHASALEWLAEVNDTLPGADANMQRIEVGAGGQVTVHLCWRQGGNANDTPQRLIVSNRIQWQ